MKNVWAGIALVCAFAFVVLQQQANQSSSHPNHLLGVLAGLCVIAAGIGVAAQRSADIYHGNELLDKLPAGMQKMIPAYYIRKLFRSRQAYARFNVIWVGTWSILMGIALTFAAISR